VGLDHYGWLADHFAFVLGGERLFAKHYFPAEKGTGSVARSGAAPEETLSPRCLSPFLPQLPDDDSYARDVLLKADADLTEGDCRDYQATEEHVAPFLETCVAAIDWSRYAIVGFATTFQQTMPSMCLARRIKQVRPETTIVFGGAACEGPMGIELARVFPEIDYVFLGEADLTFPPVVQQILEGRPVTLPPGVVAGAATSGKLPPLADETGRTVANALRGVPGSEVASSGAHMVEKLDELPYPDFDDYFARLKSSPLAARIDPLLFYETSRGCWWGQKHQCAFCGLNGASLAFRSKSPRRAVDELKWMVDRYGVRRGCTSDNILDFRYFHTFLPMLRESQLGLEFVYEMKTNLTRQQVQQLLDTGLRAAQLGIETFITPILKLIGKGANALQNLQTLKWFSEAGIEVKWNFLYGFPGEDPADYGKLLDLMPSIIHMAPPLAEGRVRLDRFSPYFADPAAWGMAHPRPNRAFAYVYPFPHQTLARMAYYYEYDYADGRDPLDYVAPVLEAFNTWHRLQGTVTLRAWDRPDGVLLLTDTRPCATSFQRRLTGLERQAYLYCDTGRTLENIVGMSPADTVGIRRMLDDWIAERLMVRLDNRYLSLALRARSDVGAS
jgi:ribosomal peptide maturation radical SAM protein 1